MTRIVISPLIRQIIIVICTVAITLFGLWFVTGLFKARNAARFSTLKGQLFQLMTIANSYEETTGDNVFDIAAREEKSWCLLVKEFLIKHNDWGESETKAGLEFTPSYFVPAFHRRQDTYSIQNETPFRVVKMSRCAELSEWCLAYLPDAKTDWRRHDVITEKELMAMLDYDRELTVTFVNDEREVFSMTWGIIWVR